MGVRVSRVLRVATISPHLDTLIGSHRHSSNQLEKGGIGRTIKSMCIVLGLQALWYTRDEARARALNDQALLEDVQRIREDELKLFALANESLLVTQSDRERVAEFYG